jgi:hypothetical protein
MKKIYTKGVLEYNKRTKRYELIESESEWHYIDDNAPIAYCGGDSGGGGAGHKQLKLSRKQIPGVVNSLI